MDRPPRGDSGFTAVEVIVTGAVLAVGACALVAALVNAMTLASVNRETAAATQAAREIVERLHGIAPCLVFRSFNKNPYDDPDGAYTAPGESFSFDAGSGIQGEGNLTARIIFPVGDDGLLRENSDDPHFGMPRDLNGDGSIDGNDHSGDYVLLPLRVRISWQGVTGLRFVETSTVLGDG
jgi:hypothetical protein